MSFFASITDRIGAIRALLGDVPDATLLPAAAERLDDADAVELLELASAVGQVAERLRVVAAGSVALRSSREAGHAGLAQSQGHRSAVSLVQQVAGVSRGEAARQVRVGESLYSTAGSGASVREAGGRDGGAGVGDVPPDSDPDSDSDTAPDARGPWHAPLGQALLSGTISAAQHDAILRGLGLPSGHDRVQARMDAAAWSLALEELIVEAGRRTVEDLAKAARSVRDRLDPEGAEERYQARYEQRSFRTWTDRDGLHHAELVSDDGAAAWLRSIVGSALRPRRGGPRFVDPGEQARARTLVEDPRTNEQLAHDLIIDLLRAGALATPESVYGTKQAGVRLVQVVDRDGAPGAGYFEDDPAPVPPSRVEQQLCESGVVPVTIDRAGRPLDVGREQRRYTPRQRVALAVRDGGCRWSGCDRPPAYCEAHHIDEWRRDLGRTDLERGILLCRFHHMQLHSNGWRITRNGADDFVLHDPGGGRTVLPARIELRYAWAGIDPPPPRFRAAA